MNEVVYSPFSYVRAALADRYPDIHLVIRSIKNDGVSKHNPEGKPLALIVSWTQDDDSYTTLLNVDEKVSLNELKVIVKKFAWIIDRELSR